MLNFLFYVGFTYFFIYEISKMIQFKKYYNFINTFNNDDVNIFKLLYIIFISLPYITFIIFFFVQSTGDRFIFCSLMLILSILYAITYKIKSSSYNILIDSILSISIFLWYLLKSKGLI